MIAAHSKENTTEGGGASESSHSREDHRQSIIQTAVCRSREEAEGEGVYDYESSSPAGWVRAPGVHEVVHSVDEVKKLIEEVK